MRWRSYGSALVVAAVMGAGVVPPALVVAAVPADVAARWQPLRPRAGDPTYARAELKRSWRDHRKKRYARTCKSCERLRARLMKRGAALFYKPERKGADLGAIKSFMNRYVRGKTPLLQVVHEVLVPSAAFRSLAVDACMRAHRPQFARHFIEQAAVSSKDSRLRTAVAVVRMAAGQNAAEIGWLIAAKGGGARAALLRATGAPRAIRERHIAEARKVMGLAEREDLEAVISWLKRSE